MRSHLGEPAHLTGPAHLHINNPLDVQRFVIYFFAPNSPILRKSCSKEEEEAEEGQNGNCKALFKNVYSGI